MGLLLESLKIDVLHGFGGRISGGWAEALSTGNRGDAGDVAPTLLSEITIGTTHHTGEAYTIGLKGGKFDISRKLSILLADARGIEKEIHTTHAFNESHQPGISIGTGNVDRLDISSANAI